MANKYVDHGIYASAIGAVPTWGVPQDGDGTATTAATAAGTAAIVFSANATGGSSSVSICGITFTATTHFTVGGSLSATLDNLVAAINANSGQGAVAVSASVTPGVPKLCNLVFARNTGGTTLEIMMRAGSTSLNGAINSFCTLTSANWTTGTSLPVSFAGGTGGCWGWFANPSNTGIGVGASLTQLTYGVFLDKTVAGIVAAGDTIYIRGGGTVDIATANGVVCNVNTKGTDPLPIEFLVDDGTVWTADAGLSLEFNFIQSSTSNNTVINFPTVGRTIFTGKIYSSGVSNFRWKYSSTSGSIFSLTLNCLNTNTLFNNCFFGNYCTSNANFVIAINTGSAFHHRPCIFRRCEFRLTLNKSLFIGANYSYATNFIGCIFNMNNVATATVSGIFSDTNSSAEHRYTFNGCSFTGFITGSKLFNTAYSPLTGLVIRDCNFGGITDLGLNVLDSAISTSAKFISLSSSVVGRDFISATPNLIADWNPTLNFPVLDALLPNGVTTFSLRAQTSTSSAMVGKVSPANLPRLAKKNTLGATRLSFSVELLMDTTLPTWTTEDVSFYITYEDASGNLVTDTFEPSMGIGASLASSSAVWSPQDGSGNPFFGAFLYSKKKLTGLTSVIAKANTEISMYVSIRRPIVNSTQLLFFNPDLSLVAYP